MTTAQDQNAQLGFGADITGRIVEYWGQVWTIKGRNFIGDWDVERSEARSAGAVKITSSIAPTILSETHPHFARLVPRN